MAKGRTFPYSKWLVIRPYNPVFIAQLIAGGQRVIVDPLMNVEFLKVTPISIPSNISLLATSCHGVWAAHFMKYNKQHRFYCVGSKSGKLAMALGWQNVVIPGYGIKDVLPHIQDKRVLYLRGERIANPIDCCMEQIVYRMHDKDGLSQKSIEALCDENISVVVGFYSKHTAELFNKLTADLPLRNNIAYAISRNILDLLPASKWQERLFWLDKKPQIV